MNEILRWCQTILGPVEALADSSREHPGQRASLMRVRAASGIYYVKTHRDPDHWEREVHGYERWAHAFGDHAPRLIAVREENPQALIISELPGRLMEGAPLTEEQEHTTWHAAGRALAELHALPPGDFFGPCRRDGSPAGAVFTEAVAYVSAQFDHWLARAAVTGCLFSDEQATIRTAMDGISAFAGARPTPCHRDYCPVNWLVTEDGRWSGVIDFEFSHWDVRAADFTRSASWEWLEKPEMMAAFYAGYGRDFSEAEAQQILVMHTLYALAAVAWGVEHEYYGFAAEGRVALRKLREVVNG